MSYEYQIHFTLAEARALLPGVVQMLQRLRSLKRALDARHYDINVHKYFGGPVTNGVKEYPNEMRDLMEIFHRLTGQGVVLRDVDRGLIDFPAIRSDGQEACLCFILGEPDIRFWHAVDEGFSGRKPIETF